LLATAHYGSSIQERYRTIAALAIEDCPKRDQKGYSAEMDIAAILMRIIHGDPRQNGGHFKIPHWASDYRPATRPAHRPRGDYTTHLQSLRNLLLRYGDGLRIEFLTTQRGHEKLSAAALARHLKVTPRSVRRYLATLEQQHEILRDQADGRTGQLIITLLPHFGHVPDKDSQTTKRLPRMHAAEKCP
jgi:hypothetical protein